MPGQDPAGHLEGRRQARFSRRARSGVSVRGTVRTDIWGATQHNVLLNQLHCHEAGRATGGWRRRKYCRPCNAPSKQLLPLVVKAILGSNFERERCCYHCLEWRVGGPTARRTEAPAMLTAQPPGAVLLNGRHARAPHTSCSFQGAARRRSSDRMGPVDVCNQGGEDFSASKMSQSQKEASR